MAGTVPVTVRLRVPRDVASLALVRGIADQTLRAAGVTADCRYDIASALTEACGNAVRHATTARDYGVTVTVTGKVCTVEVADEGVGFTATGAPVRPSPSAPTGRGLYLIAQLADHVEVDAVPGGGTTVRFVKKLSLVTGH
jgi:serine/threonine-protein kinase RsbW